MGIKVYLLFYKLYIFFRELTPTGNETPMEIEDLLSSDEEGSFDKYTRNDKALKRKIENENVDTEVSPKKRLLNGEKVPTEENQNRVNSDHSYCVPQQVYSPPPIPDWEANLKTSDKVVINQPVVSKQKTPETMPKKTKQPLAVIDSNTIENIEQSIAQKHSQVKSKHLSRRDMVQEATILFEFLTKGIDVEDINYLKQSYDSLLTNDKTHYWLNESHWVSHPDILLIKFSNRFFIIVCIRYLIFKNDLVELF